MKRQLRLSPVLPGFVGIAAILLVSCTGQLGPTSTAVRTCTEQEATADGRLVCIKGISPASDEPDICAEGRSYAGNVEYRPIDEQRREGIVERAKSQRPEVWQSIANAPFEFEVDWCGTMGDQQVDSASEWLRGGLLGADAVLRVAMGPKRGQLKQAIRATGELNEDFVKGASANSLHEAASELENVEAQLADLSTNTRELFSGLYDGLDGVNASTACYRRFAESELLLQATIAALARTVSNSRTHLVARYGTKSTQEAAQRERDRKAWSVAGADMCRAVKKATDCDGIDAYLKGFPSGEHAEEANGILASVAATLGPARDEAAWSAARVAECESPKASTACDGVKAYLEKLPQGRHAVEGARMLRLRRGALVQLAALEDQRRRIAKARMQQDCVVKGCVKTLRACQKQCEEEPAEALMGCHKSCLSTFRGTCVPGCKK